MLVDLTVDLIFMSFTGFLTVCIGSITFYSFNSIIKNLKEIDQLLENLEDKEN